MKGLRVPISDGSRPKSWNTSTCFESTEQTCEYKVLSEHYHIDMSSLKSGRFGKVYNVIDKITRQRRAVKIVEKSPQDPKATLNKLNELRIMEKIDHPNLVNIIEHFEDLKYIYMVMEYVNDGELFEQIIKKESLSEKVVLSIMKQLLSAVNYLHSINIVHRDIKSENIMLDGGILKLIDFGTHAVLTNDKKLEEFTGSAYYIAPEVVRGDYDEKCDIWSCGVLMYILLAGRPPFDGWNINYIISAIIKGDIKYNIPEFEGISAEALELMKKLLTYEANDRITASEALQHKWFKMANKTYMTYINWSILTNLKNFDNRYKLQQLLYQFLVKKILDLTYKNQIINSFNAFDINSDGTLSKEEIVRGLSKAYNSLNHKEISAIVDKLISDNATSINFTEFIAKVIDKRIMLTEDNIKKCFFLIDTNNDQTISKSELKEALNNKNLTDQDIEQILDSNNAIKMNDKLTFAEFKALLLNK